MGDDQQRALVAIEPLFEPQRGFHVEVVRRFVEQQQVRGSHQRGGQVEADAPATRESGDGVVEFVGAEAESGEQLHSAVADVVAADLVHFTMPVGDLCAIAGLVGREHIALDLAVVLVAINHVIDRRLR